MPTTTKYSLAEETSPSQYLDADYYLAAKLEQMKKTDPSYTMDQLLAAFKESGLTVGEHYDLYGSTEGINPSAAFDQAKYMADKLAQLQKKPNLTPDGPPPRCRKRLTKPA